MLGFRGTGTAVDGNTYSRALQAAATHYLKVSCGNGSYVGTYTFQTQNPPLGNTAPDYIPFNPAQFGNYGWPTVNYTAPTSNAPANTQIDPLTGFQLQRWTGPGDGGDDVSGWGSFSGVMDLSSSWTSSANILGTSGYATYSGAGGPANALFLWGASGIERPSFTATEFFGLDDIQTRISGFATVSGASYSMCLVADGGTSASDCLGTTVTVSLPQTTPATLYAPSGTWPRPLLAGWGSARVTNDMLTNTFGGSISAVSGSTVTWGANSSFGQNVYFPVTVLRPGMWVGIAGTAPACPNNVCTVASIQDEQHITIQQNLSSWTPLFTTVTSAVSPGATSISVASSAGFLLLPWPANGSGYPITLDTGSNAETFWCTGLSGLTLSGCRGVSKSHASGTGIGENLYEFVNFGVKLWVNPNGGAVSLNTVQNNFARSNQFFTEFQGAGTTGCDGISHPVTYAADGVTPLAAPTTGYLCTFVDQWFVNSGSNSYLYLMIPSTGESRKLSNFNNGTVLGYSYNTSTGFIQNCVYNDNPSDSAHQKFAVWSDNRNSSLQNSAITCVPLQTSKSVQQEIAAAYPQIDFNYFGFPALQDMQYPFAKFMMRPSQGAITWFCDLDISQPAGAGQVQNCHNSWDTYPSRWAGIHGFEYFQIFNSTYSRGYSDMYSMSHLGNMGSAAIEQWNVTVSQIYNNGGSLALASNFVDPQTCEQLGVTDSRWIALGATGNHCIQMDLSDPLATSPASKDMQSLGSLPVGSRPGPWPHNASSCGGDNTTSNCYSYLQSIQPGDFLVDSSATPYELMLVAAVSPLSGNSNVTAHVVFARGLQPFPGDCGPQRSHASGFQLTEWLPFDCYYPGFNLFPNGNVAAGKMDNDLLKAGHTIEWFAGSNMITSGPYVIDFAKDLGGYGAGYGIRLGQPLTVWGSGAMWGVQSLFPFDKSFKGLGISIIQSHAGGLTYGCPACEWIVDGRPLGGAGGGASQLWNHTYTKVAGTNSLYRIDLPEGQNTALDLKRQAVRMWAGQHLIQNISGPTSSLTDATPWKGCIVSNAGECVPGSSPGQIYEVVPQANTTFGCQIDMTINTPCVAPMAPEVAAYAQHDISGPDPLGLGGRILTTALGGPGRTNNYANMHVLTNGDWGVTTVAWGDGRRSDVWGIRLPPLPNVDSIIRNTFVPLPLSLGGQPGSSVRVRFGYAEYGSDSNSQPLFCSPNRQEDCTTAVSNGDPYAFATEPQTWTACSNSCLVNVPAVSGRVLYYVIDRKLSNGSIVSSPLELAVLK